MAPTLSRNKRKIERPQSDTSMFDMLAPQETGPQPPPDPEANQPPSVEDLMGQMAEMQRQFEARIDAAERANLALTQPVALPQTPPSQPTFSLDGLPDPVADPGKYAQEIAQRTVQYQDEMARYNRQRNAPQPQLGNPDVLWEDFAEQYSDYAENADQIAFATQKAVKEAQKRGIDVSRYMYQNTDRFFRDIIKHYDSVFGKPGEGEGESEPASSPRRGRGDGEEATRTGGIMGGVDYGARRPPAQQPANDMLDDLRAWQKKHGYHA